MIKKVITFFAAMALALSLAGCAPVRPSEDAAPAAEQQTAADVQAPVEEDGQNPVMNFIGVYSTEYSTEALVEAEGAENARITVTYAGSPWFHHQTIMSGRFDPENLTVEFTNAVMTEYTYNSDGSEAPAAEAGDPAGAEGPAADTVRQDGERFETVIVLEGMEQTVGYEYIRSVSAAFHTMVNTISVIGG